MGFVDSFPDRVLMNTLGDDIDYLINGIRYPIKAIVDKDVETVGGDFRIPERRTEVEFLKADIPRYAVQGDVVDLGSHTLVVQSIVSDDGVYIRLAMRKG